MTKRQLILELWRLVRTHDPKQGRYCKSDCSLRGELRGLLKSIRVTSERRQA